MGAVLAFRRKVERINRQVDDTLGVCLDDFRALCEGRCTGIYCTVCAEPLRPDVATCPNCGTPNPARV